MLYRSKTKRAPGQHIRLKYGTRATHVGHPEIRKNDWIFHKMEMLGQKRNESLTHLSPWQKKSNDYFPDYKAASKARLFWGAPNNFKLSEKVYVRAAASKLTEKRFSGSVMRYHKRKITQTANKESRRHNDG